MKVSKFYILFFLFCVCGSSSLLSMDAIFGGGRSGSSTSYSRSTRTMPFAGNGGARITDREEEKEGIGAKILRYGAYGAIGAVAVGAFFAYKQFVESRAAVPESNLDTADQCVITLPEKNESGTRKNPQDDDREKEESAAAIATTTKSYAIVKPAEKQKEKKKKKENLRCCKICGAALKLRGDGQGILVGECAGAIGGTSFCEKDSSHNLYNACYDVVGSAIGAAGGVFSVTLGAAGAPITIPVVFFSLLGGILLYKGLQIFKKLIKEPNESYGYDITPESIQECKDGEKINQYLLELSPQAQDKVAEITEDIDCIEKDYRENRIKKSFYQDLCNHRAGWSLEKRELDKNVFDDMVLLLSKDSDFGAKHILQHINHRKYIYWHDVGCISRWHARGMLNARQKAYYLDCLKKRLYKDSESITELFQEWSESQGDYSYTAISFAKYAMDTVAPIISRIGCGGLPSGEGPPDLQECFPINPLMPDIPIGFDMLPDALKEQLPQGCGNIPLEEAVKDHKIGCTFLSTEIVDQIFLLFKESKEDEKANEQYNGPIYIRTEDWVNDDPFAQSIKNAVKRSDYINQGKRAFKITKKIPGVTGLNKGDYVAVDALHKNHLEVFNSRGEWKHVADFDGTKNEKKTEQAGRGDQRYQLKKG